MKTLRSIFSITLCLIFSVAVFSQDESESEEVLRTKGLRFGFDLSRFALYYFEPERREYQFSVDMEVGRNFYPVLEYGFQQVNFEDSLFNYTSEGWYMRAGLDYNFLKNKRPDQYEIVFGGIRYGMAFLDHSADQITVTDPLWGESVNGTITQNNVRAGWIEVTGGIRAELFKNFFIGWSFSARLLIYDTGNDNFKPYHIPGFGRGDSKTSLGFNYSVYYRIPLYKSSYQKKRKDS